MEMALQIDVLSHVWVLLCSKVSHRDEDNRGRLNLESIISGRFVE